ncbi:MAG TPA: serine--tRNA ligase [Rhizomicrobium sp.]|jgi:seryl-tRNA synthetase|nr:serine--tRNA ligase [Rhizomicrobium sp.]
MHDIKYIRDNTDAFVAGLDRRGGADGGAIASQLLKLDEELRAVLVALQQKQARRNEASKLIGQAKAKKDEAGAAALMAEVAGLKDAIAQGEADERRLNEELKAALAVLPNIPADDVPLGADEHANVAIEARRFNPVKHVPASGINAPKEHFTLGEALGLMDFERAAKVSGARFVYLKGALAKLSRALASFMLDSHTEKFGYTEVMPPLLVREPAMFGTGQLPKFKDDLFAASNGLMFDTINKSFQMSSKPDVQSVTSGIRVEEAFWLIPTAEVPLTNYVNGEILAEAELPLRFTAYTPCFRAEAGAAGKDTRGMIRMHQFDKVELVSITTPEQSNAEHERMTDAAQEILKCLDLKHQVMTLCSGDMGFAARKTYDIEVWLPGQNRFREISSCSNCGDFQGRRMNTRVRGADGKVKGPVHTLNGSGLAIGRTIVAILENYQEADGSIAVPDALKPYMGGLEKIAR